LDRRFVKLLPNEKRFCLFGFDRRHADVCQTNAGGFASAGIVKRDLNCNARCREVADFSLEFQICAATLRRRKWNPNLGEYFFRFECGGKEAREEVCNRDLPFAFWTGSNYGCSECKHRRGMIVRRIAVSEIPANRRLASHQR